MFRSFRLGSMLSLLGLSLLLGIWADDVPTADAACRSNFVYVDSGAGVDRGGCWGTNAADAYLTLSAALADRNANYSGTTITIYFKGDVNQTLDNSGSSNNVYLRPQVLGATTKAVFTVKGSNYITVSNFKFAGSGGVKMNGTANNVTVDSNTFSTSTSFVEVTSKNTVNIQNNTFQSAFVYDHNNAGRVSIWTNTFTGAASKSGYHVYVTAQSSGGIDFVGNKVTSTGGNTLYMASTTGAIIMSNTLTGPGSVTATAVQLSTTTGIIQNNTVTGYGKAFMASGTGATNLNIVDKNKVTLTDTAVAESIGFGFTGMTVTHFTNNSVSGGDFGLKVSQTVVSEIKTNTFAALSWGIYADGLSTLTTISTNTFTSVGTGMWLVSSTFATIDSNQIAATTYGILLESTKNSFTSWNSESAPTDPPSATVAYQSKIQNNALTGMSVGIAMAAYDVDTVSKNTFLNVVDGVDQFYSAITTFKNNDLEHDTTKAAGRGVYVYGSSFGDFIQNHFNAFETGFTMEQVSTVLTSFNGNLFSGGTYGLSLDNSAVTPLMTNNVFAAMPYGVYLKAGTTGFNLVYSTFYGNNTPVTLAVNLPAGNVVKLANNVYSQFTTYAVNVQDLADLAVLDYNVYDHVAGGAIVTSPTVALNLVDAKGYGFETQGYEENGVTLTNPAGGDFHLKFVSSAVNSADDSYGVTKDFDRSGRPVCSVTDRGAFEASSLFPGATNDTDGDGLCRFQETAWGTDDALSDTDSDGLNDHNEIFSYLTTPTSNDTDGDAYSDGEEVLSYSTDPLDAASHPNDADRDGMDDTWETTYGLDPTVNDAADDLDSDWLTNLEEYTAGMDPSDSDMDDDGLSDGDEIINGTDYTRPDTDSDGMPDGWEISYGLSGLSDDSADDLDSDGLSNLEEYNDDTSPVDSDTDGDGMDDGWEVPYGLDPTSNDAALDSDRDGLTNLDEYSLGTDPSAADTDGDGYDDGVEVTYGTDPLDAASYPAILDDDGDGMDDAWEALYSCVNDTVDDSANDPDADGLTNYEEYTYSSNPCSSDSDSDSMDDGWEAAYGLDLNVDDSATDTDGDGLSNVQEYVLGTDPTDADTDGDGFVDGAEVTADTDPLDATDFPPDGDMDGMADDWEASYSCMNPAVNDAATDDDSDGFTALQEYEYGTNPCSSDTDADGMSDDWEIGYGLNATVSSASTDSDSDGLTDFVEYGLGSDPTDTDTDGDGMPDGWENTYGLNVLVNDAASDLDLDTLTNLQEYTLGTNPAGADTDGDGMPDGWENGYGLLPTVDDSTGDFDGDALSNVDEFIAGTNPTVSDTDGDGYNDGMEVSAGTDPLDSADHPTDFDGDGMDDTWEASYSCMDAAVADASTDSDADGLTALQEYGYGTDPCTADTDGDTYNDGDEITAGTDPLDATSHTLDADSDGLPDSWESTYTCMDAAVADESMDSDSDGLTALQEYGDGTDPCSADTDGDALNDGDEVTEGTDPLLMDTDGDSYDDGVEVTAGSDPLDAASDPTMFVDTDGDGLTDTEEATLGTSPTSNDSDGDLFTDGYEVDQGSSPTRSSSVPILTLQFVGYTLLDGYGTSGSWISSYALPYTTSLSIDFSTSTPEFFETYFSSTDSGAFGVYFDPTQYLGSVSVTYCGQGDVVWDPTLNSCDVISDYTSVTYPDLTITHATDSSQLSMWSSLSAYYIFDQWNWYRMKTPDYANNYQAFKVVLAP